MGEIKVENSAEVRAPAEKVWEQLTNVNSWPEWKPFMKRAKIASGYKSISCGSKIKMGIMMAGPASVPLAVEVTEFDKPKRLAWEGGVAGLLHAVHSFDIEDRGGSCVVTSSEVFKGLLTSALLLLVTEKDLEKLHQDWVTAIKNRLENGA